MGRSERFSAFETAKTRVQRFGRTEAARRIAAQYSTKPAPSAVGGQYIADAREPGDPEFVKDVEINDVRNRYMLTKGTTQSQIHKDTGATVTTKGNWYPDKSLATEGAPPLYLHITASTLEVLQMGVAKVEELINTEMGPLTERKDERGRRKWHEEKMPVGLDNLRNFNVRAKVVGPGGIFVKFIQGETQTRVQIKGQGSGFLETDTGRESDEPMHISITGPDNAMIEKAREWAEDLLTVVTDEWSKARQLLETYNTPMQPAQAPPIYMGYGAPIVVQQPPPPPPDGSAPPPPPPGSEVPPAPPSDATSATLGATDPQQDAYKEWYIQASASVPPPPNYTGDAKTYWTGLLNDPQYMVWAQQYITSYVQIAQQFASGNPPPPPPGAAGQPPQPGTEQPPPPPPSNGAPPPPPTPAKGAYSAVPPPVGL
ncbi:hypothetical protein BT69DRAFT_487501 [Atractiella rhizophila]|nr:hypothetical protein BT69DRAFT_487501 [Atractiella rhizophila]